MSDEELKRPDPDQLLDGIKKEESASVQGKLKIFFGMCAGVGKTYSMLNAAQKARRDGVNIVIGIVETHGRTETEELLDGLESVQLKNIEYRGSYFKELDLDAILALNPTLVLVDELAHTNIPGSRHAKRYQDVLELLNNGIDVYTTLNVQHLESRAEIVNQITGTTVRETVPDSIFDRAEEVELIDITIDKLLERLSEGKVYTVERSSLAIQNFFRKGNLTALREMALRLTAERVDKDLRDYKTEQNIDIVWKSGQRLMVAIGPSPFSANLIRWTRRLAYSLEATWIAVYVETNRKISEENKNTLADNFSLAKELGAEVITTQDTDIISALVRIARENNVTQIIIGKTRESNSISNLSRKSFVRELLRRSGDIDVYVVGGEKTSGKKPAWIETLRPQSPFHRYVISFLLIILLTVIFYSVSHHIGYQTVSLLFLLTISILPLFNFGPGPILLAALSSAFCWDYFFIPPKFTFTIAKVEDTLMLIMYFIVASVAGLLTSKIRKQQLFLQQKEQRTSSLYNLTKELSSANTIDDIAEVTVNQIKRTFDSDVVIIFYESENKLRTKPHSSSTVALDDNEWHIANWVFMNGQKAGRFSNTLSLSSFTFYPLKSKSGSLGVVGIKTTNLQMLSFDQESLLDTFLTQIANTVEREYLNDVAKKSLLVQESEKLYKTLFNSISHELKTPITTIIGAASSLNDQKIFNNKSILNKLLEEINIAADRLNRLVENLLDMARLESGNLKLKLDWYSVADLINSVMNRMKSEIVERKIKINIQEDLPLLKLDFGLMEQALRNILHNSIEYSPKQSEIYIEAKRLNNNCIINISDSGKGFPEETLEKLFDKFYRIPGTKAGGTGLGLSISKGFVEAHGGSIAASNRPSGGALFSISIPFVIES